MNKYNFDNEEVNQALNELTDEICAKNNDKRGRWLSESEFSNSFGSSPESCNGDEEQCETVSLDVTGLSETKVRLRFDSESLAKVDLNANMKESLLTKF